MNWLLFLHFSSLFHISSSIACHKLSSRSLIMIISFWQNKKKMLLRSNLFAFKFSSTVLMFENVILLVAARIKTKERPQWQSFFGGFVCIGIHISSSQILASFVMIRLNFSARVRSEFFENVERETSSFLRGLYKMKNALRYFRDLRWRFFEFFSSYDLLNFWILRTWNFMKAFSSIICVSLKAFEILIGSLELWNFCENRELL